MPSMKTLEFTRMPAGRPGDAAAADESTSCKYPGQIKTGVLSVSLLEPEAVREGAAVSPLLRRIDKPLRLGETQACTWAVAGAACVRARVHASIAGGL